MYYIAHVKNLLIPVASELDSLTYEDAMYWMEKTGNIIEYTIQNKINNMKSYKIEMIEGIGPIFSNKFKSLNIDTTIELLENTKTLMQRQEISKKLDISEKLILKFAIIAELSKIDKVGEEYSELLERSGITNTTELSLSNSEILMSKLQEVNNEKELVRKMPTLVQVQEWIEDANKIPTVIEY